MTKRPSNEDFRDQMHEEAREAARLEVDHLRIIAEEQGGWAHEDLATPEARETLRKLTKAIACAILIRERRGFPRKSPGDLAMLILEMHRFGTRDDVTETVGVEQHIEKLRRRIGRESSPPPDPGTGLKDLN